MEYVHLTRRLAAPESIRSRPLFPALPALKTSSLLAPAALRNPGGALPSPVSRVSAPPVWVVPRPASTLALPPALLVPPPTLTLRPNVI